jgi:hypothetical protein
MKLTINLLYKHRDAPIKYITPSIPEGGVELVLLERG